MATLFKQLPIAEKLWADEKDPNKYTIESKAIIKWQCEQGHIYKKAINAFARNHECQICRQLNNRLKNNPKAVEMWDYEKNEIDINKVTLRSSKSRWWKCSNGHSFSMQCDRFNDKNGECPLCNMDTIDKHPELMEQFDLENNPDIDIHTTSCNSKKIANWKCKKCGYSWKTKIVSRHLSANHCPCCEEKTVVMAGFNDIFTLYPKLKMDFNDEFDPSTEGVSSFKQTKWKCHVCDYEWITALGARIKDGKISKCPACAGLVRTKSYAEQYPELKKYYSESNPIPLENLITGQQTKEKFLWKCDKHGEFDQYLGVMIRSLKTEFKGCPYCTGKKVKLEDSFGYNHPELIDEYSPKNNLDIFNICLNSSRIALWHCPKCNNEWKTNFNTRHHGFGFCRTCFPHSKYKRMLIDERPDLEKFYRGQRPFNSYSFLSNEEVEWECEEGHQFKKIVYNLSRDEEFKCPICADVRLVVGVNDLASNYPELVEEWSPNNERKPNEVVKSSNMYAKWICKKCGYEYQVKIQEKINGYICPVCDDKKLLTGFNDLATKYPKLVESYLDENELPANKVLYTSKKDFKWGCPTCSGKYKTTIFGRQGDNCPYCNDWKFLPGHNDLKTKYPDLAKLFSKNNPVTVDEVFYKSHDYFNWYCPTCGGEYYTSITGIQENHCPYCENRKVLPGFNDLETLYPEIAKSFSKQNDYPANQVLCKGNYDHLWDCPTCGGTYKATFDERKDDKCPYCSNKKVLAGFNDLATTHPQAAKEWGIENYLLGIDGPENYKFDSKKRAYWKCSNCGTRYKMPIDDYIIKGKRGHEPCWKCVGRMKNILKL